MTRNRIIQFCQQIRTFTKSLSEHPLKEVKRDVAVLCHMTEGITGSRLHLTGKTSDAAVPVFRVGINLTTNICV
jgi:hypothetical protein